MLSWCIAHHYFTGKRFSRIVILTFPRGQCIQPFSVDHTRGDGRLALLEMLFERWDVLEGLRSSM